MDEEVKNETSPIFPIGLNGVYDIVQTREMVTFCQYIIIALLIVVGLLAFAIRGMMPLKQYVPIIGTIMTSDDVYFQHVKLADLSVDKMQILVTNQLREYVLMRERIDTPAQQKIRNIKIRYSSTPQIIEQYVEDIKARPKGVKRDVYINTDDMIQYAAPNTNQLGTHQIHFSITDINGENSNKGKYVATIKYGYSTETQNEEMMKNNLLNLVVYEYTIRRWSDTQQNNFLSLEETQ